MADRTPPIRTYCAEPPRVAPIEGRKKGRPISTNRGDGHPPISTNRGAPPDLVELLHAPAPEDVKMTRVAAGHTQVQAAAAIGLQRWQTWSDYEGGKHQMPALSWTWYLLATGAHPVAMLKRKPKPRGQQSAAMASISSRVV